MEENKGYSVSEQLGNLLSVDGSEKDNKSINEKINGKMSDEDKKLFGLENKQKTQLIGSKDDKDEDGLTKEQREKLKKMYHDEVVKRFKTQFLQIVDLMKRRKQTLMEVYEDVDNKVSYLPRAARETITGFKPEALMEYLKEFGVEASEFGERKTVKHNKD